MSAYETEAKLRSFLKEHPMQLPLHEISKYLRTGLYTLEFKSSAALLKSKDFDLFPVYQMEITVSSDKMFKKVLHPEMNEIAKKNECTLVVLPSPIIGKHPRIQATCWKYDVNMFHREDFRKVGVEVILRDP